MKRRTIFFSTILILIMVALPLMCIGAEKKGSSKPIVLKFATYFPEVNCIG